MKKIIAASALLTLFAPILSADFVRLVPPDPDSNDSIEVRMGGSWRDGCVPRDPEVSVAGTEITITLTAGTKSCPAVITAWRADATIPPLAPGYYTVHVFLPLEPDADPVLWRSISFPVREADVEFEILPSSGPAAGGYEVTILGQFGECTVTPPCPVPEVLFDGVPSPSVRDIPGGVVATVPPHAEGTADVELRTRDGMPLETISSGFFYFAPASEPHPAAFKPFLLPVFFEGPGARESDWTTDAWVFNRGEAPVAPLNAATILLCPADADPCQSEFPPHETLQIQHGADRRDRGLILYVPRSQAEDLELSLHIRDLSRQSESAGTEIPVVSEEDLQEDFVQLLNIPVDSRFRQTLRIFSVDGDSGARVQIQAFPMSGESRNLGLVVMTLEGGEECADEICHPLEPATAVLNDFRSAFPDIGETERVRLDIRPVDEALRLWAFVSVTNNDTQQVTTVTPD